MTTNQTQHTSGPWSVQELGLARGESYPEWNRFAVRSPSNVCLAVVGDVDRYGCDAFEANARLIAAAPDLLAALEATLDTLTIVEPSALDWICVPNDDGLDNNLGVIIRAAIARARGEA